MPTSTSAGVLEWGAGGSSINNAGSGTNPVYTSGGSVVASTSTVGSNASNTFKPVYLNSGTITAVSQTVGANTANALKPVYANAGTITALSNSSGGTAKPVYVDAGAIKPISDTVGANTPNTTTAANGTAKPVYLNAGTITALSATAGSATNPVYLNAGTITKTTYGLNATVNSGTANKLAYYSGANAIDDYTSTVGANTANAAVPMYLNAGVPTAISVTSGGTAKPVYLNAGKIAPISDTVGQVGNTTTASKPVYLNSGTITVCANAIPVDQVVSSSTYYPIYMANDTTAGSIEKINMAAQATYSFNPSTKKWKYTSTDGTALTFGLAKVASW